MNLDDELRAALRREDPSPGFADRVVARAKSSPAPKVIPIFKPVRMPRMMWATALAAMLVVGFAVTTEYRQMKAERAAQEAVMALRIAADKLNMTRDKVLRREN
jgi:hypothetical protein